jgi:murein DD-endopeptidase MepM/ murein hydrolase activator NlpD
MLGLARSLLPLVIASAAYVQTPPLLAPGAAAGSTSSVLAGSPRADGTWSWPVGGIVLRRFDGPETPFGSGHRGIDIAAAVGTTVTAPEAGTVAFAGTVGGDLFVTLDHGAGLTSTYSWVSEALVRRGDVVPRGGAIARSGPGHPGSETPHLHFGVRLDGAYLDPLDFLTPIDVSAFIRLAPLAGA